MGYFRCWSVRNVLDLRVDGRLPPGASAKVDSHLQNCVPCQTAFEESGGIKNLLSKAKKISVPAGLASSILKKVGTAPAPKPVWTFTPAQGAALAYLAMTLLANRLPGPPSQSARAGAPWSWEIKK